MSTPISRNSKLQGPALYAPPHVRARVSSSDERASAAETTAATEPETEQLETEQAEAAQPETGEAEAEPLDRDKAAAVESVDSGNGTNDADALDWVDQAIRAVIELEHASDGHAPSGPAAAPRSPPIASAREESDERPPPSLGARYRNQSDSRRARPQRPRLEPELVPEPPVRMERGGAFPLVMRFSLVVVFAAIVAYGVTMLASSQSGMPWLKAARSRVAELAPPSHQAPAPPPSRLIVEDQQAFANEPLSLVVSVEHARNNESLLLDGLVRGTTLSAGASKGPSSWQLPYDKLRGLYLYAPKDFVGVMNTAVDLIGPDKHLLDSRTMQLKWVARKPKPAPAVKMASAEPTAGELGRAKLAMPAIEPIDPGEAAVLMQKGQDLLTTGDISAARVAFSRLADAGIAKAALALANTYDPNYLAAHNFFGVQGNLATARTLYQRAKALGAAEADQYLARLAN